MSYLWSNLRQYRWLLLVAIISATINQVFSLLDPQLFRILTDNYITKIDQLTRTEFLRGLGFWMLGTIGVAMVSRIAKASQDYFINVVVQSTGTDLYNKGIQHSLSLPFTVFEDQRSGETLQQLQKAKTDSQDLITSLVNTALVSLVTLLFVAIYAFSVHWSIGLTILLMFPLLGFFIGSLSRQIKKTQDLIFKQAANLAGSTTETLRNIELIKALGLEQQEVNRLNETNQQILKLELKKVKTLRLLSFVQGTLINFMRVLLLSLMAYLIFVGAITLGQFFSLMFYSFFIFQPLGELGNLISKVQETRSSLENYNAIMAKQPVKDEEDSQPVSAINSIAFSRVNYTHAGNSNHALKQVSFEVKKGESIAFVGPSGAGKSTLIKLLIGLYKPTKGQIFYNETPAHKLQSESIRQRIGLVPQSIELFAGTIRDNLLFVQPNATDAECLKVLKQAQLNNVLKRANKGLNTVIGEGGMKLSGGERQRLAIARALLRQPEILIFDEATSNLDSATEAEITKTIKDITNQGANLITLLIAHRLSTIAHADRIIVLEKGQIAEQGTHTALLKKKGLYYALWRQQSSE